VAQQSDLSDAEVQNLLYFNVDQELQWSLVEILSKINFQLRALKNETDARRYALLSSDFGGIDAQDFISDEEYNAATWDGVIDVAPSKNRVRDMRQALDLLIAEANVIINGDFNIWQRGTSFAAAANGDYTADRFLYAKSGAMVHTISQSTDVPTVAQAGHLSNHSFLVDCTTADTSLASTDQCTLQQRIEGYDFLKIAQRTFTLGFWVKATKTGTYCVAFMNSGNDRTYVAEYTVGASDTWEYKTVTVSASPSAGTWDYTNGVGLFVFWTLAAGSSFQTTAGAWNTGNFRATANQVNACDSTLNDFRLSQIIIVPGEVAVPFVGRSHGNELSRCERYFEKTYDQGTNPGTATEVGGHFERKSDTLSSVLWGHNYHTSKRSAPAITIYSPSTGASGKARDFDAGADVVCTASNASDSAFRTFLGTASATEHQIAYQWTADAEL
jgi:hypothetical protein